MSILHPVRAVRTRIAARIAATDVVDQKHAEVLGGSITRGARGRRTYHRDLTATPSYEIRINDCGRCCDTTSREMCLSCAPK